MFKGAHGKRYTGEFKQLVAEIIRNKKLGCAEAVERFAVAQQSVGEWNGSALRMWRKQSKSSTVVVEAGIGAGYLDLISN